MRRFLELLQQHKCPAFHPDEFSRRIGAETYGALCEEGVLTETGPVQSYACGEGGGEGCRREVISNDGNEKHPFVAVCGREAKYCSSTLLRRDDVRSTSVSFHALAIAIMRAMHSDGRAERTDAFAETWQLGRVTWGAEVRELWFCSSPERDGFSSFLAARQARRESALVVVPLKAAVPAVLRDSFGEGAKVELGFLDEILAISSGRLVAAMPAAISDQSDDRSMPAVARCFQGNGWREITQAELDGVRAASADFDLFFDRLAGTRLEVRVRLKRGAPPKSTKLTSDESTALMSLLQARSPLTAAQLLPDQRAVPRKTVERLRSKLEGRGGARGKWVLIHTHSSREAGLARYQFEPPKGFTVAILAPLLASDC